MIMDMAENFWIIWSGPVDFKILTSRFGLKPVDFFPESQKYVFTIKQSLKACHKLCIIYIIFFSRPRKGDVGDWGLR